MIAGSEGGAVGGNDGGFVQGHSADFSNIDDGSNSKASKPHGGMGLFANAWKAAQKLASDIGAGDMLHDMKSQMNKVKAQQYGDKLKLVESTEDVETAMAYIKETKIKYAHLLSVLQDMAVENAKIAGPLRRVGAAFVKCATISDRVARDLATSGKESFFKETPTYQQDLNEALMVTSGAMLYQADRSQSMYTTSETMDASRANFEQGNYSTKYYTKQERFGPGPISELTQVVEELVRNEIGDAVRMRNKYKTARLDASIQQRELEDSKGKGKLSDEEVKELEEDLEKNLQTMSNAREDMLSAYKALCQSKKKVAASVEKLLEEEKNMHAEAIKSLRNTLKSLPNAPIDLSEG